MTPRLIHSADDLITSHEATCQGFLDQAKVKAERAAPYLRAACGFWEALARVSSPADLAGVPEIKEGLVATAGVSAKTRRYLTSADIARILSGVIDGIPADQRAEWRKEVFYRYLLRSRAQINARIWR